MKAVLRGFALSVAMLAEPVMAQGVPEGCYVRDYSASHLAEQPAQVVDWMQLWVYSEEGFNRQANMLVGFSNQGHVAKTKHAGRVLDQYLSCFEYDGRRGCSVACDGGSFTVTRDAGDSMTIETRYLMVGETDTCGGAVDLAEKPGQSVKYKLYRADASQCEAARTVYDFVDTEGGLENNEVADEGPSDDGESK